MFFNYPDEYSVPVNYCDNLIEKSDRELEDKDIDAEKEKSLLRITDPFWENMESKENDLIISNSKRKNSIFEEADEEYIQNEIKFNV